jgi:hypothetical protein
MRDSGFEPGSEEWNRFYPTAEGDRRRKAREDHHVLLAEANIEQLAAKYPPVREALARAEGTWTNDSPELRLRKREAVVMADLDRYQARTARDLGLPPPSNVSFSTNPVRTQPDDSSPQLVTGQSIVNERRLYRAFAILMDLMFEAVDDPSRFAKPDIVPTSVEKFIALMDDYVRERRKQSSWVLALQLKPLLSQFFKDAKRTWPTQGPKVDHLSRVPKKPTREEGEALRAQERRLAELVRSVGFDPSRPEVQRFIQNTKCSRQYIADPEGKRGPERLAADAAARLAAIGGEGFSGSAIEHYLMSKRHIDATASRDPFRFLIDERVPRISGFDVLNAQTIARSARAYLLRHLVGENAKRDILSEGDDLLGGNSWRTARERESAQRLGLPEAACYPRQYVRCKVRELETWNLNDREPDVPLHLDIQARPFDFGLQRPPSILPSSDARQIVNRLVTRKRKAPRKINRLGSRCLRRRP